MGVVVETLVGFVVMFKHGERFVHRSGVVAARWFRDVVQYPAEIEDKLHAFSCKDMECLLNYQFREIILFISLPNKTWAQLSIPTTILLISRPNDTSSTLNYKFRQQFSFISLPNQTSCFGTNLPSKKLLKLVSLKSFLVLWGSCSTIIFLRMSSIAEL